MASRKNNGNPSILIIGLKGLPARGGAASVGAVLIKALSAKYQFTVLSVSSHTAAKTGLYEGVRQIVFPSFGSGGLNTLLYYFRCLAHALTHRYDMVHLHHAESGFITPFLKLRYKVVVTFHGVFSYHDPKFPRLHNRFFRFSEKLNVRYADEVISVSGIDAVYIERKYGRAIQYIPNGVSVTTSAQPKRPASSYILFAAGRIYGIKGLHLLLKALRDLKADKKLVVAGKMEEISSYKQEIERLSSGLPVEFVGMITVKSDLLALVAGAQMFVFPSLTEAMSMMLLEAASTGVPIIASDIPANRAVFDDNEVLFFKSDDHTDLKDKLQFALRNTALMEEMGERTKARVLRDYTTEVVCARYDQIYKRLS